MKKIKILLFGSGNMAKEHFKAFSSFINFKFVGVVARNKQKLKKFSEKYQIPYFSTDPIKAHIDTKPDLVIIAVSELSLHDLCRKIVKFNSTLLIEKPMGYNYEQSKKIAQLFNSNKKNAFIAMNRRHYQSTRQLIKILSKRKGKRFVVVNDQEDLIQQKKNNVPNKVIKNFMYANSIHLIDYFNIFCRGRLLNVNTINNFNKEPYFVQSTLNFSSGDTGIYFATYNKPAPWFVTIKLNNNFFVLKPLENLNSNIKIIKPKIQDSNDKDFKPGFKLQAKEVLNYFLGKKHLLPSYKDALESINIIKYIYR